MDGGDSKVGQKNTTGQDRQDGQEGMPVEGCIGGKEKLAGGVGKFGEDSKPGEHRKA
jgi:hypothetical protein